MLILIFLLTILFLYHSNNLLLSLLILEMLGFIVLFYFSFNLHSFLDADYVVLVFSLFLLWKVLLLCLGLLCLLGFQVLIMSDLLGC